MEIKTIFSPDAAEPVAFAAAELSAYLGRMLAGEKGAVTISLGVRPDQDPGLPDWFSVKLKGTEGFIVGNRSGSVLLGAYDCLRRLGCRFLAPGKVGEVVPTITRKELMLKYEHRASFYHRGVCIEGANSRENVLDFKNVLKWK